MAGDDKRRWPGLDFGGGGNGGESQPRWRSPLWYLLIGMVLVWVLLAQVAPGPEEVPYSRFLALVEQGRVESVFISESRVEGTFEDDGTQRTFSTTRPPGVDEQQLLSLLQDRGVEFSGRQPGAFTNILLSWVIPIAILVLIWMFIFRRMAGGGGAAGALNLGKRGVKIFDRKDLKTTFADVAGLDEAVEELGEVVEFLKTPKKYQRLGGKIPKGVLLLGPPGCGKTLLARAVAGEAQVPFFYMSGSEFVEMFVGLGAARVRELFQQAKEKAPCLVFLDELDTIGKTRGGALGAGMGSHDEREQTLNQLLVEMDGFDTSKGVIIMAATNRPDVLDPALLRPGRFDRQVVVDRPDLRGREAILKVHAREVVLAEDVDPQVIASRTPGFTGADLANVVNEAALLAARREKDSVGMEELEEAIDRVVAGLERKSRVMSDREREITAVHEMGHALVGLSVENADPVHRVSIIPRGMGALGMTLYRPLEDRYIYTEAQLKDQLAISLGGRVAEEVMFDHLSSGAGDDLRRATDLARRMITELGMSRKLGPIAFGGDGFRSAQGQMLFPGQGKEMSEETARRIDEEIVSLINEARDRARGILDERRDLLERLSKLLMDKEVLEGKELKRLVEGEVTHDERVDTSEPPTTEAPAKSEDADAGSENEPHPRKKKRKDRDGDGEPTRKIPRHPTQEMPRQR